MLIFRWKAEASGFPASTFLAYRFRGGAIQVANVFDTRDSGSKIVFDEALFFARPEAGEDQDSLSDARLAHLDSFVGASDAEPFNSGFLKGLRDRHGAEAVGVRLDHREDSRLRTYVLAHYSQVVQDGLERNLCPHRPSLGMNGLCLRSAHKRGLLGCQSQRARRATNSLHQNRPRRLGKHANLELCNRIAAGTQGLAGRGCRCIYSSICILTRPQDGFGPLGGVRSPCATTHPAGMD